ncbi:hypothetical protein ACOJUR_12100 [Alicyclobacillus tolerans]|uniref:hypothetical protein n=1 Tax=Alicyclobacillus tolerans TaxID=90970 RepID=UPI003B777621
MSNNEFQKSFEVRGETYTFRVPSALDIIEIERETKKLADGVLESPLAVMFANSIAMLTRLCLFPKDADFQKLPDFVVSQLSSEVANWLNSFRENLGTEKSSTGEGQSA